MKNSTLQHNVAAHRSRYLLIFLVLLAIGGVIWVFVSIYASQNTTTLPPEATAAATPLDPNLNTAVLDKLETKSIYSEEELANFPIYVIKTDRFTRTQTVVPLESSQL